MQAIDRLQGLVRRLQRARKFGFPYSRDKFWTLPSAIRIDGRMMPLTLPRDEGTRIACKDIFLDDVYGLTELKVSPHTIVDIGGHAGLFALCARILFPDAEIHLYEPNPDMGRYLDHQATLGRLVVFPEAIGANAARATLVPGADSVFAATVNDPAGNICVTSISQAIDRIGGHIDLLKLDCEGCEWEILANTAAMKHVDAITMEYHLSAGRTLPDLENLIRSAGFDVHFNHADGEANGRIWARHGR